MAHKPVTRTICDSNVKNVLDKIEGVHAHVKEIETVLRGAQGRNGIVRDVNFLMTQDKNQQIFTSTVIGIIAALVTAAAREIIILLVTG